MRKKSITTLTIILSLSLLIIIGIVYVQSSNNSENNEGSLIDPQYVYVFFEDKKRSEYESYDIRIPKISIDEDIDKVVNTNIDKLFYEPAQNEIERGYARYDIGFFSCINDGIVSLAIEGHQGNGTSGRTYYITNIDINTGMFVTLPMILEKYGYTWTDLQNEICGPGMEEHLSYGYLNSAIIMDDVNNFYINENNELVVILNIVSYPFNSEGNSFLYDHFQYYLEYNLITKESRVFRAIGRQLP